VTGGQFNQLLTFFDVVASSKRASGSLRIVRPNNPPFASSDSELLRSPARRGQK
jgi:hypothetical protein